MRFKVMIKEAYMYHSYVMGMSESILKLKAEVSSSKIIEWVNTMKMMKTKTWQHEITGFDGNAVLFGVNIFDYDWGDMGYSVPVKDPLYGQDYNFRVYKVIIDRKEYLFAAGEFSNGVYGFYVERY